MRHRYELLPYYKSMSNKIKHKQCLHIRSNLYEIGRCYYKKFCDNHLNILSMTGKNKNLNDLQIKHYNNFLKSTDLTYEATFGSNLLYYFYWEYIMGTWIPEVLQESDFIFNTHSFVDCRKILELFLSLDFNSRINASVFKHTINNLNDISKIPINPKKYNFIVATDFNKVDSDFLGYQISYTSSKNLSINKIFQDNKKMLESSITKHIVYPQKNISFSDLNNENFSPHEPTIYSIDWHGVKFYFLLRRISTSNKVVLWGHGAIDKKKPMPVFHRHTWGSEIDVNGIWYFDPSCYLGEANLCWGYGTNDRWFLKDIAYIIWCILKKWGISTSDALFFGSSGGGFTSIALATFLRAKAFVINPQLFCEKYNSIALNRFKSSCLKDNEELKSERLNIFLIMKKKDIVQKHIFFRIFLLLMTLKISGHNLFILFLSYVYLKFLFKLDFINTKTAT